MKTIFFAISLLFPSLTFAADNSAVNVVVDHDQTFVSLDIDRVVSQTDVSGACGVQNAALIYLDRQHVKHILNYLIQGNCPNEN